MTVIYHLQNSPVLKKPAVFTFGTFDGVHLGHKHIFNIQQQEAKKRKCPSAVLTFSNHPLELIKPSEHIRRLTSDAKKVSLLKEAGFSLVVDIPFDKTIRDMSAEEFIKKISRMVPFSCLVVGTDVAFGKDRKGDKNFLETLEKEFSSVFVDKLCIDGAPVSSSHIREAVAKGNFEEAASFLGRPYSIEAKRTSEYEWDPLDYALPPIGLYQAYIRYNDQEEWHEAQVRVTSILEITERSYDSHSAEVQFIKEVL